MFEYGAKVYDKKTGKVYETRSEQTAKRVSEWDGRSRLPGLVPLEGETVPTENFKQTRERFLVSKSTGITDALGVPVFQCDLCLIEDRSGEHKAGIYDMDGNFVAVWYDGRQIVKKDLTWVCVIEVLGRLGTLTDREHVNAHVRPPVNTKLTFNIPLRWRIKKAVSHYVYG